MNTSASLHYGEDLDDLPAEGLTPAAALVYSDSLTDRIPEHPTYAALTQRAIALMRESAQIAHSLPPVPPAMGAISDVVRRAHSVLGRKYDDAVERRAVRERAIRKDWETWFKDVQMTFFYVHGPSPTVRFTVQNIPEAFTMRDIPMRWDLEKNGRVTQMNAFLRSTLPWLTSGAALDALDATRTDATEEEQERLRGKFLRTLIAEEQLGVHLAPVLRAGGVSEQELEMEAAEQRWDAYLENNSSSFRRAKYGPNYEAWDQRGLFEAMDEEQRIAFLLNSEDYNLQQAGAAIARGMELLADLEALGENVLDRRDALRDAFHGIIDTHYRVPTPEDEYADYDDWANRW